MRQTAARIVGVFAVGALAGIALPSRVCAAP